METVEELKFFVSSFEDCGSCSSLEVLVENRLLFWSVKNSSELSTTIKSKNSIKS